MEPWLFLPPTPWREAISALGTGVLSRLEEIRFRVDVPVMLYTDRESIQLTNEGIPVIARGQDIRRILAILVDHSLYARVEELRQGYITLPGGHRVGVAGRAVWQDGHIVTQTDITGLNIRYARDVNGGAKVLMENLRRRGIAGNSWVIVAPPRAGKTTMLRDLTRWFSQAGWRVVVVDERSEIAGPGTGHRGFDLGPHTDVLEGWSKSEGILTAVRTLGPDMVVVDELGPEADLDAVIKARHAGVEVITTLHGSEQNGLAGARLKRLWQSQIFDAVVFLGRSPGPGAVVGVWPPAPWGRDGIAL